MILTRRAHSRKSFVEIYLDAGASRRRHLVHATRVARSIAPSTTRSAIKISRRFSRACVFKEINGKGATGTLVTGAQTMGRRDAAWTCHETWLVPKSRFVARRVKQTTLTTSRKKVSIGRTTAKNTRFLSTRYFFTLCQLNLSIKAGLKWTFYISTETFELRFGLCLKKWCIDFYFIRVTTRCKMIRKTRRRTSGTCRPRKLPPRWCGTVITAPRGAWAGSITASGACSARAAVTWLWSTRRTWRRRRPWASRDSRRRRRSRDAASSTSGARGPRGPRAAGRAAPGSRRVTAPVVSSTPGKTALLPLY